jgi:putative flavoprotein involved in K+ transport
VPLGIDLSSGEIRCVVWATGYRPDYSWLNVPVLDRKGQLVHDGGVVSSPGMYALGLPFLRRRKSSFIHGAEDDVRDVGGHLKSYLDSYPGKHTVRVAI